MLSRPSQFHYCAATLLFVCQKNKVQPNASRLICMKSMASDYCKHHLKSFNNSYEDFAPYFAVMNFLTSLSAIVLNAFVIVAIWKTPSLHTPSRLLLCSLALTDFCIGAFVQPFIVMFSVAAIVHWPNVLCICLGTSFRIGYCLGGISLATLTAISVDRYLAIQTKTAYRTLVTKKKISIFLLSCWTTVTCAIILLFEILYQFLVIVSTAMVVLCLVIITILTVKSFRALKRQTVQVSSTNSKHLPSSQKVCDFNVFKYRRSLITMMMILAAILTSYLPFTVFSVMELFMASFGVMDVLKIYLSYFLVVLNSTLNPILYLWRMTELRQASKQLLCKK